MHMLGGFNVEAIILKQTLRYHFNQPCLTEDTVEVKITEHLGSNCNQLRSFPFGVSHSILKTIAAMVVKHMPSPGIPQFTRSVFMLDVGLQFSTWVARLDSPGGSMQLFCGVNVNVARYIALLFALFEKPRKKFSSNHVLQNKNLA